MKTAEQPAAPTSRETTAILDSPAGASEPVIEDALTSLAREAQELDFESFGYGDAWAVGSHLVHLATDRELPVVATIFFGDQRVFHAALPGTSADNDDWLERKIRTVRRFGRASMQVSTQFQSVGLRLENLPHLDPALFAGAGGAVPIRIRGSIVGIIAVSGLTDQADHDLAIEALHHHLHGHEAVRADTGETA
ncbi:heme-degrading domain-containing protein [Paenarthrobacter sp. YAF11_1]|uniref:heme-degrading domain-containing protein n=1 Tax=Paenarthrobacter sp. YAF11_1 TaxID=3233074 RepID=UPI003F9C2445